MRERREQLREQLRGVMTAMVTPFHANGVLNLEALREHVDFQIESGVKILVVAGTIGEALALETVERYAITEQVIQLVEARALVLVGVGSDRPENVRELALHAAEAGADGLLASLPPHFKLTEAEQFDFCSWLDGESSLPWVLYGATNAASGAPSLDLLEQLQGSSGLAAYKEPRPDLARLHAIIDRFGATLPLIAASEVVLPQALMAGAVGAMTATACFAPKLIEGMINGIETGDLSAVNAAFSPILEFRSCFQSRMQAGYPSYLPYTKAACEIVGLTSGPPRSPLHAVSHQEYIQLESIIHRAIAPFGTQSSKEIFTHSK